MLSGSYENEDVSVKKCNESLIVLNMVKCILWRPATDGNCVRSSASDAFTTEFHAICKHVTHVIGVIFITVLWIQ